METGYYLADVVRATHRVILSGSPCPSQLITIPVLLPLPAPLPFAASSSSIPSSPSPAHRRRVRPMEVCDPAPAPEEPALPKILRHCSSASSDSSNIAGSEGGWNVQDVNRLVGMNAMAAREFQ